MLPDPSKLVCKMTADTLELDEEDIHSDILRCLPWPYIERWTSEVSRQVALPEYKTYLFYIIKNDCMILSYTYSESIHSSDPSVCL